MKKLALLLMVMLLAMPAGAVLKEKDFGRTLDVLQAELEQAYKEQKTKTNIYRQRSTNQHNELVAMMQRIDQVALILYSQRRDFTFDMAYACQQATDLYRNNRIERLPYQQIVSSLESEIERYDSIIVVLKGISPAINDQHSDSTTVVDSLVQSNKTDGKVKAFTLNARQQRQREKCLFYATSIRENMAQMALHIHEDQYYYDQVTTKLEAINGYALKRYEELRASIFENANQNYFQILAQLPRMTKQSYMDVNDKYTNLKRKGKLVESQWRGPIILGVSAFILLYIAIASLLSAAILRWIVPRRIRQTDFYRSKRVYLGFACGVFLFAVCISIGAAFTNHNFIDMAIGISIDFAWLILVILLSIIIRLNTKQLRAAIRVYTPFMLMAFIVIVFRIIFIPNNMVYLIFPPVLLVFTIWQALVLRRRTVKLPDSDVLFSAISLAAMIVSCVMSWLGYTLLAVQTIIWWSFQLACIQTIICLYDLLSMYKRKFLLRKIKAKATNELPEVKATKRNRHKQAETIESDEKLLERAAKGDFITVTYLFDFVEKALLPVVAVLSILQSVVFAAGIFDMKQLVFKAFFYNFINKAGILQLSFYKLILVGGLFFVFHYFNYAAHAFYKYYITHKHKENVSYRANMTLANNVITIAVWGAYFIIVLFVFQVPKGGISLITAGLATGLGFAMKDILENFIYGLSLMSGRVRVGDFIQCDDILGRVERITYQSTQVVTLEGSVIAFLNTQLFNKNFKNLTRNNSYEMVKVPVGVAYGSDVNTVRNILVEELSKLPTTKNGRNIIQKKQGFKVLFGDFGASSVDLIVAFWVAVEEKIAFVAQVKETIYNTLRQNKVEIPFPQRDIYIRQVPTVQQPDEEK